MAISTFDELKTAVTTWAKRADLAALIPDFITLAEVRINRTFDPTGTETEATLATVASSRFVALPTGMMNPTSCWLEDFDDRRELFKRLPDDLDVDDDNGYPDYWAIDGANIAFECPCEAVWPLYLRYQAPFALSDANPTNYVLTRNPDLYLWATMVEVSAYTEDVQAAAMYEGRYSAALQLALNRENDNRQAQLVTEFGNTGAKANIFQG